MASNHQPPVEDLFADDAVPTERQSASLDARELPPPEPLKNTLERLEALEAGVLYQYNDRAPQHLYPRLQERGYQYRTVEDGDVVVTAIWEE